MAKHVRRVMRIAVTIVGLSAVVPSLAGAEPVVVATATDPIAKAMQYGVTPELVFTSALKGFSADVPRSKSRSCARTSAC